MKRETGSQGIKTNVIIPWIIFYMTCTFSAIKARKVLFKLDFLQRWVKQTFIKVLYTYIILKYTIENYV